MLGLSNSVGNSGEKPMEFERIITLFRLVSGIMLLGAVTSSGCGLAHAQTQFSSITSFGESYADRGNVNCFQSAGPANCSYPRHGLCPTNAVVPFSYQLQQLYGIPNSRAFDYATAGSSATSGLFGYSQEVQFSTFLAQGGHLAWPRRPRAEAHRTKRLLHPQPELSPHILQHRV